MHSVHVNGRVRINKANTDDYLWVGKQELAEYLQPEVLALTKTMLFCQSELHAVTPDEGLLPDHSTVHVPRQPQAPEETTQSALQQ
jgi:hypothetical protein